MFDLFGWLRACKVSVTALGVFVYAVFFKLLAQTWAERSRETKTHVQKDFPKKVALPALCGPQNRQRRPVYIFLIQLINAN